MGALQTAPTGPSSVRPTPLANSTRRTPRKRTRVDCPAARPRLGEPGFSIEEYVTHHAGSRLGAYRYYALRVSVGKDTKVTFHVVRREVTSDSRYCFWESRWRHIGNRVHRWSTLDGLDIMRYRIPEDRDYFARHISFLERIFDGEEPIARWYDLDPTEHFSPLTRLDAFRMAHRWVRDYD